MSSALSNPSTRSPISEVPYDVLREIFLHCLPRYPLDSPQPDTTIAPMQLCQICSSWRTIVLSSPSLWSHLSYCLTMQLSEPDLESWALRQGEIDFILWWKNNQGSMAPVLRLDFEPGDVDEGIPLAGDGMAILQKYVTSAQYLQVEPEFWEQIYNKFTFGDQVVFPNVHTLVTDGPRSRYDVDYCFYDAQVRIGLIPAYPSSTLRRLAIAKDTLPEKVIIPNHWSALTHLSMSNIEIPLNFWYSLIRAVPELQWAHFNFEGIDIPDNYTEPPTRYILPQLSALFIIYGGEYDNYIELPLSMIFAGLHLPALQELSLWSFADSWKDPPCAILELYTVLQSTPAITTLTLRGYGFLSLHRASYPTILAGIGDVDSFWSHTPQLTHLQLQFPLIHNFSHADASEQLDTFVSNILSDHSCLALHGPRCPIQTITLIKAAYSIPSFDITRDLTMSSIQRHIGGASNIAFKIILGFDSEDDGEKEWREWGSRNY